MPRVRGLLHLRPKIDEEEQALAQARLAVRLADLFGDGDPGSPRDVSAGDESPDAVEVLDDPTADARLATAAPGPSRRPGGHRPPIVVIGDPGATGTEPGSDEAGLVSVMARAGEDVGDDGWALPVADPAQLATAASPEGAGAPSNDDAPPKARPARSRATRSRTATSAGTRPSGRTAAGKARAGSPRSGAARGARSKGRSAPVPPAFCPYCALLLEPPPANSRRCTRCRQRIVVKRVDGRAIYLTEAAVLVFDAERRRIASSGRWGRERERWLRLAAAAGASAERHARLAGSPLSEQVVEATRALYMSTVDRAFRAARRDHDWEMASRIRREQATALHRLARSPSPPPTELVAMYREGVAAELRGIAEISRDAELVSAQCCDACRQDDRSTFRITQELRMPRLPHEGCPRGLCRCRWDLAARDRTTMRRYLRRRTRPDAAVAPDAPLPTA